MTISFILSSFFLLMAGAGLSAIQPENKPQETLLKTVEYQPKNYSYLYGMKGFSDSLLKMHFQLYEGYVKNTNLLVNRLKQLETQNQTLGFDYGAIKHRFGWEWDGMRLHEYYFENLGGKLPLDKNALLFQKIVEEFGSYEAWKQDFVATGLMRGIGWVILYQDPRTGRLFNTWINEHDVGHLAGGTPLLVMDVFEHAYITEYGLDKKGYIEAFFANIDWVKAAGRLPAQPAQ
jgi:superoxide dismutase, Fe-Mn family